jgi:hypothetical protein
MHIYYLRMENEINGALCLYRLGFIWVVTFMIRIRDKTGQKQNVIIDETFPYKHYYHTAQTEQHHEVFFPHWRHLKRPRPPSFDCRSLAQSRLGHFTADLLRFEGRELDLDKCFNGDFLESDAMGDRVGEGGTLLSLMK